MSKHKTYDHEEILKLYESGEKLCVISALLGCHQTTVNYAVRTAKVQPRRVKREYSMLELVQQSPGMPARRLAQLMGTTTAYVNKLRYQAKKKAAQSN